MDVLSFSGGKDSTAMLLRLIEIGTPPDIIIYFDGGWEFPQMNAHIKEIQKRIAPLAITTLRGKRGGKEIDFDFMLSSYKKIRGVTKGCIGYGWPHASRRWCTRIKTDTLDSFSKKLEPHSTLIGIAADELHRERELTSAGSPTRHPLIEWGWTEKDCLNYCYSKGLTWGGLYKHFKRVSCWCCPLQPVAELRKLYKYFPSLWDRLEQMQAAVTAVNGGASRSGASCEFKTNRKIYESTVSGWTLRFQEEGLGEADQ